MNNDDLAAELAGLQPKTKVGKLRKYLPVIEQKLTEGATAQDILEVLKKHGIEMSVGTFRFYLHQYRAQNKSGQGYYPKEPFSTQAVTQVAENNQSEMGDSKEALQPISVQELAEVMQPDPNKLAAEIAEKERLYKEHEKSLKRK